MIVQSIETDILGSFRYYECIGCFVRLIINESVSRQMGIHQLGVRKKILDALKETHKKSWETSSITPIDYNRKITYVWSKIVSNSCMWFMYYAGKGRMNGDKILLSNKYRIVITWLAFEPGFTRATLFPSKWMHDPEISSV